jgi:hypothetical protein
MVREKNKSYQIGDLLYHPAKRLGSKYAVVVDIFNARKKPEHLCVGVPGFGVIWMDNPGDVYEFSNNEWCETDKGFRLAASA